MNETGVAPSPVVSEHSDEVGSQAPTEAPRASQNMRVVDSDAAPVKASALEPGHMPVSIRFLGRVGQEDFACGKVFDGVGQSNTSIRPLDFRFYVHDLRLINDQGQEVAVSLQDRPLWQSQGVALLDFENNDGVCGLGGDVRTNKTVEGSIPEGNYKGLRFTLGVPSSLNHLDPLTMEGPFQAGGMQWSWLFGFKFARIELAPAVATEGGEAKIGVFHLGSTACEEGDGGISCAKRNQGEVFLPEFTLDGHNVVADLGEVFAKSDLSVKRSCHSGGDDCVPFFEQVGVNFETGLSAEGQRFFSTAQAPSAPAPVAGGSGLILLGMGLLSFARRGRSKRCAR